MAKNNAFTCNLEWEELQKKAKELGRQIKDKERELAELALEEEGKDYWLKYLYYEKSSSSEMLGEVMGVEPHSVRSVLGPTIVHKTCDGCGDALIEVEVKSKTAYKETMKGSYRIVCEDCQKREKEAFKKSQSEGRKLHLEWENKIKKLKSMPYHEYLRTKHWDSVRKRALKRSGYNCQLCNSREELHVHHRTYENKGCEHYNDLIVLCSHCHAKFHDKMKVAE